MGVLIDTSVWSLALRRRREATGPVPAALQRVLAQQQGVLLGLVRMELLSAVASEQFLASLKQKLREYPDLPLETEDYEMAADIRSACRRKGVQGSLADFLLCAAGVRREMAIFTLDRDFQKMSRLVPIDLHLPHLMDA